MTMSAQASMITFFWGGASHKGYRSGEKPVSASGFVRKTPGRTSTSHSPVIKIYTPDARGTNDHVGQGLHDHSYLPCQSPGSCSTQSCTAQYTFVRPLYMWDVPLGFHLPSHTYVTQNLWGGPYL